MPEPSAEQGNMVCDGSGTCPAETHILGCFRSKAEPVAEQGDVAVIREALEVAERNAVTMMDGERSIAGRAALDRLTAAIASRDAALGMQRSAWGRNIREREAAEAALERAEQEFDTDGRSVHLLNSFYENLVRDAKRAEKAERALGEMREAAEEYIEAAEGFGSGKHDDPQWPEQALARLRALALRSEEASDE